MSLTETQKTTLKAHILASADQEVTDAWVGGNNTGLAAIYNRDSAETVWRTLVDKSEYCGSAGLDWTEVDNLSAGKARIWEWLTSYLTVAFNPADPNVRAGLSQAFGSGTTTRANLLALSVRLATIAEDVLATGTGTKTMTFEGDLTLQDIRDIRNA